MDYGCKIWGTNNTKGMRDEGYGTYPPQILERYVRG